MNCENISHFSVGNNFLTSLENVTIQPNKSLGLFMDSFVKQRNNKFCVFPNPSLDTHTLAHCWQTLDTVDTETEHVTMAPRMKVSAGHATCNCLFEAEKYEDDA